MRGINLRNKDFLEGMRMFETDRHVDATLIIDILKEAIVKTYQKHIDAPDAQVRVEISPENEMHIYHDLKVVADDTDKFDETLDILLSEAKEINPSAQIGDVITREVDFAEIGRSSISVAKNMLKQRIKEFEKQRIYDEYKDKLYDLISGIIKTVDEKFVLIDIHNTIGIMTKQEQIPGEIYREGQTIRVVIKEVQKSSKGSQVILSRANEMFVKRLFEREVPEIAQGIIEIKAIARDAGERTKMAVYSHNEDVDAIGSCIGPRGSRVQAVISEIRGEKIDVFEWNDNLGELVKNALAPAEIYAVFYADDAVNEDTDSYYHNNKRPLMVVVEDDQLSVAIGKKGKNARLAVKLTNRKIDIKTLSAVHEMDIDIPTRIAAFRADQERLRAERQQKAFLAQQEEARKRQEEFAAEVAANDTGFDETVLDEMDTPLPEEEVTIMDDITTEKEEAENTAVATKEIPAEKRPSEVDKPVRKKKELTPKTGFVSKFEKIADGGNKSEEKVTYKKRKKRDEEEERRLRPEDLDTDKEYAIKPEYTEEELEEIALAEEAEENDSWINDDIDFDEYEEYYSDEEE